MYTKKELELMSKEDLVDYILKIQFHLLQISVEIDKITCTKHE